MRRTFIIAAILATLAVLMLASVALAQDDPGVETAESVATLIGLTALTTLVMQGIRLILAKVPEIFDQWGGAIAMVVAILISFAGALQRSEDLSTMWFNLAALGLTAGLLSQPLNSAVVRAVKPEETVPVNPPA